MSGKAHYCIRYVFSPNEPWDHSSDRGMGTTSSDQSYVEVLVDGRFANFFLVECTRRMWDTDNKFHNRGERWIRDEVSFDLQDLLLKRGTYQLLHHTTTFKTLARESIQALIEGSLTLTIAKNVLDILIPLMVKERPELGRILKYLKPYYLDEPVLAPKKPRKKKS